MATTGTNSSARQDHTVSVVVPVYNEEANLPVLFARLAPVLDGCGAAWDVVFVDDGSRDGSWGAIQALRARDPRVRGVRFSRNFGHHVALTAGFDRAEGDVVISMDSDLQDRPEDIPVLLAKLDEGYDIVYSLRKTREEAAWKGVSSRAFFRVLRWMTEGRLSYEGGVFRATRRPVVVALRGCREQGRMVTGIINWLGFRQAGVDLPHAGRHAGETKYRLGRSVAMAMNGITAFSIRPLRLAYAAGGILVALGIVAGIAALGSRSGWLGASAVVLLVGGVDLLFLGVLGEYVGRTFRESQGRPLYVVGETVGFEAGGEERGSGK